jgi:hypothetical protein
MSFSSILLRGDCRLFMWTWVQLSLLSSCPCTERIAELTKLWRNNTKLLFTIYTLHSIEYFKVSRRAEAAWRLQGKEEHLKDLGVSGNEVLKYVLKTGLGLGWSEVWSYNRKCLHQLENYQHYLPFTMELSADCSDRAVLGMKYLLSLEHWDHGFESHLGHGCLCSVMPFDGLISHPRSPTDCLRLRNWSETKRFKDALCSKWEQ